MKKILLIEDNRGITEGLCDTFTEPEYELLTAGNLKEAGALLSEHPGLVLLDVSLPDGNGFDFYSERLEKEKTPVIFLTARDEENDIVKGLELGAEDYITKPFSVDELLARISAHLRREERKSTVSNLKFNNELIIDYNSRTVFLGKEQLEFSNKEFEIIQFLSQNAGMVFDRETIYEKLWGYDGEGDSIVIKEHIRKIRNKLSIYTDKNYIETVWGVGYKWIK